MRYTEFRDTIAQALGRCPDGMTWKELKHSLDLPYERACPNWTARLEAEIGLLRVKRKGNALVWTLRESPAVDRQPDRP